MTEFSSQYLDARLSIYADRLISFDQRQQLIDMDIERLLPLVSQSNPLKTKASPDIDNQLATQVLDEFRIILRPFSGNEKRFFHFATRWFDIMNLKVLIRGKFTNTPNQLIRDQLINLEDFGDLPLDILMDTDDAYEMLRVLQGTAYSSIVQHARHVFEERGNELFMLDAAIDRSFFNGLKDRTRFLHEQDIAPLTDAVGIVLDRFNLTWLLRYRFNYELSPAKSYYLLATPGKRLHGKLLMQLAKLENTEAVIQELPEPYRAAIGTHNQTTDIEIIMEQNMQSSMMRILRHSDNLVSRCFAFMVLRELEMRFLQALLNGKKQQLDSSLIHQAIGGRQ